MPGKKDESERLLGSGMARKAAKTIRSSQDRKKKQLDSIMKDIRSTRKGK